MAIETKSLADASGNWTQVTPGRSDAYVRNSVARVNKWSSNTIDGIPNYRAAVSGAGVENRIRQNVQGKGQRRYTAKIQAVGASRFGSGVQAAKSEYEQGFGPMLSVIQGVTLPGKGPRGDPRNYQRVQAVGDALHRARMMATASGG